MNNVNQKNYFYISDYEKFEGMLYKRVAELHQKYGDDYYSMPIYKIKPSRATIINEKTDDKKELYNILFEELEVLPNKYKNFALSYYLLFDNTFNSFFILDRLMMIYNSEIVEKGDKGGYPDYEHILNYDEKTVLLERTFNILKSLTNRDDILKSFLRNTISRNLTEADKKKKMWYYLLNDTSFLEGILSFSDFRKQNPEYDKEKDSVLRYEKYEHLYEKYNTDVLEEKINSFLIKESQSR